MSSGTVKLVGNYVVVVPESVSKIIKHVGSSNEAKIIGISQSMEEQYKKYELEVGKIALTRSDISKVGYPLAGGAYIIDADYIIATRDE